MEESQPKPEVNINVLVTLHGLDRDVADCLKAYGWDTLESFQDKTREHIKRVTGLSEAKIDTLVKSIQSFEGYLS